MTIPSIQTIIIDLAIGAALIYIGLCLFLMLMQNKMIFHPWDNFDDLKAYPDFKYEDIYIESTDGVKVNAWFVGKTENPDAPVILFCHGNAGNMSQFIDSAQLYNKAGFSCMLFDYRGYGRSSGSISEKGIYDDTEAVWNYLINVKKYKPENIIIAGRSLGGAPATYLASRQSPGGLIIESAFASIPEMASDLYPIFPAFLCRTKLPTASFAANLRCPVLHFHASEDEVVPFRHSTIINNAIQHSNKTFIKLQGPHNDCYFTDEKTYLSALESFLRQIHSQN